MITNGVKTSRESLSNFIHHISKFQQAQKDAVRLLQNDYVSLGNEWDDMKYLQAGDILKSVDQKVKSMEPDLDRLIQSVKKLQKSIDDYDNIHIG